MATTPHSRLVAVLTLVAIATSSCARLEALTVTDPLTPEQSRDQVLDAARDIVAAGHLWVHESALWRASCNDDGDPPFRSQMRVAYPPASSPAAADSEFTALAAQLQAIGWKADDPGFHSHAAHFTKNKVVAVLGPGNAINPDRTIEIIGECRDVTTTKDTRGGVDTAAL